MHIISTTPCKKENFFLYSLIVAAMLFMFSVVPANRCLAQETSKESIRDHVYQAAMATYIHGMTDEIAQEEFGVSSVPVLIELLADPDFPRRDNVVAVLGYLGGADSADALLSMLHNIPASVLTPDEERALLLVPQSLGQIAGRGNQNALQALMQMTFHENNGGVLAAAASRGPNPAALRDDLLHMALRGLAYSGSANALGRLQAISRGHVRPAPLGRGLEKSANQALALFNHLHSGQAVPGPSEGLTPTPDTTGPRKTDGALSENVINSAETAAPAFDSNHVHVYDSLLDYVNHVNVTNPMTDRRLDSCLADVSLHMGKVDFAADIACCAGVSRKGTGGQFGTSGDGLDLIDTSTELNTVLNNNAARVKVVRAINYCGGSGTNIIGCAWVGGNGIAVVRYGNTGTEGLLWAHEYGHNTGLGHNSSSGYIMYGVLFPENNGLTQSECDRFHTPSSGTQADQADAGVCSDNDADGVQDVVDNCPGVANSDQTDTDGNGIGDACEGPGCGNGIIETGEDCDSLNLGGTTCSSLGYDGGSLACNPDCTLDTSGCTLCGNSILETGEECDGFDVGGATCQDQGCTAGIPACTNCLLDYNSCSGCPACNNDGVCDPGENCNGCLNDCISSSGATCGNGICEAGDGEDCVSCPADCRGKQNGRPAGRYCCGDGAGENPVSCSDSKCTAGEWQCSDAMSGPSCCGDDLCGGIENSYTCEVDCGPPPFCGDGSCDPGEDQCSCTGDCGSPGTIESSCSDGIDNDCDGSPDCSDSDCADDPDCICEPAGAFCTSGSECCSGRCTGKRGARTCK